MDTEKSYFRLIDNQEHVREGDKELYKEIEPIICELLNELKANGKVNNFIPFERNRLLSIMDNIYQMDINNNWLIDILYSAEKKKSFLAFSSEFGLDETKFVHFYVQSCVLSCISHIELFKAFLLFHLIGINYKVSNFPKTMEKSAPNTWEKLKPYVDNNFRNSLAHGTWIIENNKVKLFCDAEFILCEEIELKDFILRIRKQNIIYNILVDVFKKKLRAVFFDFTNQPIKK